MTREILDHVGRSCELLALGEPTHQDPVFARIRNGLLPRLAERGFRSIALEIDRVAALAVDDHVRHGVGELDVVMREGFSHEWGEREENRRLVVWIREYNEGRPAAERLAFHGFDAPTENYSAPSPRGYLEAARDHLGLDVDIAGPAGPDERWSRTEAILDAAMSPGATEEAERLRVVGEELLTALDERGPGGSPEAWDRARTRLTAGLWLLRYHKQASRPLEPNLRVSRLMAVRDALQAQNLLDIRRVEARRGPTLVFAHNSHLQLSPSRLVAGELDLRWVGAGSIAGALLGEKYVYIPGSLGRCAAIDLDAPAPETYEGLLGERVPDWGFVDAATVAPGVVRSDMKPRQGYYPLDPAVLEGAGAVWHVNDAASARV
ncbi:erythromycin esterase family protein [Phytomonospora endophytica]|uniref:Erythromycin esterase-like protein n=1 Tax=Phytomonospora endophytica TaxID=714109 RepID=A0A841FLA9_9ACTN|nr:erythromycin esterase family protein [Phytomonospora endophytica]MBB6036725.1 erythromycin esterase-like protein [Phytomonospora endophytica]GIG68241.1 erythromycin esterase [Phytomonospora endophytica]